MFVSSASPVARLFRSRKFLLLLLDTIISLVLHFAGGQDVEFVIGALQPVFAFIIAAIAYEDAAAKRAAG